MCALALDVHPLVHTKVRSKLQLGGKVNKHRTKTVVKENGGSCPESGREGPANGEE